MWQEVLQGERKYAHPAAYSNLVGYHTTMYGSSGIEKSLDAYLSHSSSGKNTKQGCQVTLTIDSDVQEEAYRLIQGYEGSAVVLDAKTGEIIALASSPSYDITKLTENWDKLSSTNGTFLSNAFQNPVTPGSVFKLITSKAILEAGIGQEKVEDTGSLKIHGQTIRNYAGTAYGILTFKDAFVKSSNVYFMDRAMKLGGRKLADAAESFYLGKDIRLDFATIHSSFDLGDYSDNVVASTAFGQGETLVTPLQMAMITQSVANGGVMLKPYLYESAVNGKGETELEGKTQKLTKTMEETTASQIREVMKDAAESYGFSRVGNGAYSVAAKTGTAERGDGTNNAWLVTFAPAENPQYVVVLCRLKTEEIGKTLMPEAEALYDMLFSSSDR